MKNIFGLLFTLALCSSCQPGAEQLYEQTAHKAAALVIVPAIQEKVYDRPSVKG